MNICHFRTTILESQFRSLKYKPTSEQRTPFNKGLRFYVPRVVVVHRFDCTSKKHCFKELKNYSLTTPNALLHFYIANFTQFRKRYSYAFDPFKKQIAISIVTFFEWKKQLLSIEFFAKCCAFDKLNRDKTYARTGFPRYSL